MVSDGARRCAAAGHRVGRRVRLPVDLASLIMPFIAQREYNGANIR